MPELSALTVLTVQELPKPPPPPLVIASKPLSSPAGTKKNSTTLQIYYYRIPTTTELFKLVVLKSPREEKIGNDFRQDNIKQRFNNIPSTHVCSYNYNNDKRVPKARKG